MEGPPTGADVALHHARHLRAAASLLSSVLALVSAGCAASAPQSPESEATVRVASRESTELLPGGGERATIETAGLVFTASVATTAARMNEDVTILCTLTNVSNRPVHWNDFDLGVSIGGRSADGTRVTALSKGFGIAPSMQAARPLTLESGETTAFTRVLPSPYNVTGPCSLSARFGDWESSGGPGPEGRTPLISILIR